MKSGGVERRTTRFSFLACDRCSAGKLNVKTIVKQQAQNSCDHHIGRGTGNMSRDPALEGQHQDQMSTVSRVAVVFQANRNADTTESDRTQTRCDHQIDRRSGAHVKGTEELTPGLIVLVSVREPFQDQVPNPLVHCP